MLQLVRINLSEQTDATDLFGSDLPVPEDDGTSGSSSGARFAWCDGVFLRALKEGKWVLLDELNLATQVHASSHHGKGRSGSGRIGFI